MKKMILAVLFVLLGLLVTACSSGPVLDSGKVDRSALVSILNEFHKIPQTREQTATVSDYAALLEKTQLTQREVNAAVAALERLKRTIFETPMSFIDGGLEPHVRAALGVGEDVIITIGQCFSLESLDCTYRGEDARKIRVTYDFRYFPNLRSLNLSGNAVSDLSGFSYLSELEELSLAGNPAMKSGFEDVRSLQILGSLPLKHLDLSGEGTVLSFAEIPTCSALVSLDVSGNTFESFDSIGNKFPMLETLCAAGCRVENSAALQDCTGLLVLDLSHADLSDLSFLTALTALRSLVLDGIASVNPALFANASSLVQLSLSACGIESVAWLINHPQLVEVDLSQNEITDLSSLNFASHLETVNLSGNKISQFVFSSFFAEVAFLDLSRNGLMLADFSAAKGGNLHELYLSGNALMAFSLPSDLPLSRLDLSGNGLYSFSFVSDTLEFLDLSENPLTDLSLNASALTDLDLSHVPALQGTVTLSLPSLRVFHLPVGVAYPVELTDRAPFLETLSLDLSAVSADFVQKLISIKDLTVYNAPSIFFDDVKLLARLESLEVINSSVVAPVLSGFSALKKLSFRDCASLQDLSGISDLPALETLSVVGGNCVSPLLNGFHCLKSLTLSQCGLRILTGVADLPSLELLDLSANGFTAIEVVGFAQLNYLNLSGNKIASMRDLSLDLRQGTLDLSGNDKKLYQENLEISPDVFVITEGKG